MMSQSPLVRNHNSQLTSGPRETRRRSVASTCESEELLLDMRTVTGSAETLLEK